MDSFEQGLKVLIIAILAITLYILYATFSIEYILEPLIYYIHGTVTYAPEYSKIIIFIWGLFLVPSLIALGCCKIYKKVKK